MSFNQRCWRLSLARLTSVCSPVAYQMKEPIHPRSYAALRLAKGLGMASKIIVGSIRETINVQDAALAGADVVTVPPKFLLAR